MQQTLQRPSRRSVTFALAAVAAGALGLPGSASAQAWPSRPVRIIVAVPAGGPTDQLARLIGPRLTELWGQPVIVENRPGAGQTIGTAAAAKAPPDGYTLLMTTNVFPVNPYLFDKLPYDPKNDFTAVTLVATANLMLVVNPQLKVNTVQELIAYAKANPGALNFGSSGASSSLRLAVELLQSSAGVKMTHIPFNGAAPLITALVGGQVQLAVVDAAASKGQIEAGKLKALAVTGANRSPILPQLPTLAESGLPGYSAESWFGLLAPAGTPAAVVGKIQSDVAGVLKLPEVAASLRAHDETGIGNSPQEFAAFIESEGLKWGRIIRDNRITAQ